MEFFKCLNDKVDIAPLLEEINNNEDAWLIDTARQDYNKIQKNTQTIHIRKRTDRKDIKGDEDQESEWTGMEKLFPLATQFMLDVAKQVNGELSRAVIVRLKPKEAVYLHVDHGAYYLIRDRYHLVLKSQEGSILMSGGEIVTMQEGELWWFDNREHHQAQNNSDDWRVHYIFDILPEKYKELAYNPITPDEISLRLKAAKEARQQE